MKPYESTYYFLGKLFKPRSVLEIGTHLGKSLIWLVLGSGAVKLVVSVDNETLTPNSQTLAKKSLRDFGFRGKCKFIVGSITDDKVQKTLKSYTFDLINVDGLCTGKDRLRDMIIGWKFLSSNGIMIVHDYDILKRSLDRFRHKKFSLIINNNNFRHGGLIIQKR